MFSNSESSVVLCPVPLSVCLSVWVCLPPRRSRGTRALRASAGAGSDVQSQVYCSSHPDFPLPSKQGASNQTKGGLVTSSWFRVPWVALGSQRAFLLSAVALSLLRGWTLWVDQPEGAPVVAVSELLGLSRQWRERGMVKGTKALWLISSVIHTKSHGG